jgi:hypothetical protein
MKLSLKQWNTIVDALRTASRYENEQRNALRDGPSAKEHYTRCQRFYNLADDIEAGKVI